MTQSTNVPPVGPLQSKVWGATQLLFAHHNVEVHLIRFEKGGYCSRHRHKSKWNRFVCLSGKLRVVIYRQGRDEDEEIEDVTIIERGQITDVPPGAWHQFEAIENGEALELCWVTLDGEDIERDGVGGKML